MTNPSASDTSSPPYVIATHPTEVPQLVKFLHDRNHFLNVENERLLEQYEALKTDVTHQEAIVSWQHRLVSLGEEHIKLLETIAQVQHEGGSELTTWPIDERPEFQPQICGSPLNTQPGSHSQSRPMLVDEMLVAEAPGYDQGRSTNQDGQIFWPEHDQGHTLGDKGHSTSYY